MIVCVWGVCVCVGGVTALGSRSWHTLLRSKLGGSGLLTRPVYVIRPSAFDGVTF